MERLRAVEVIAFGVPGGAGLGRGRGGGKKVGEGLPVAASSWTLRIGVTGGGGGFLPHCSGLHCFPGILVVHGFSVQLVKLYLSHIQQTMSNYCVQRQQHSQSLGKEARRTV